MVHFIVNTNALAQGKEGGLAPYPEREKAPSYFYKTLEINNGIAYASIFTEPNGIRINFFGLQTPRELRGLCIVVEVGSDESKHLKVRTNFGTTLSASLLKELWPGGPYSFIMAIVSLEQILFKGTSKTLWLEKYLLDGGIGTLLQKRMTWVQLFEGFIKIF